MFTALSTIILTAATALVCASPLAARDSDPLLVMVWLAQGAVGGFCAGLGFSYLLGQLRSGSLTRSQAPSGASPLGSATNAAEAAAHSGALSLSGVTSGRAGARVATLDHHSGIAGPKNPAPAGWSEMPPAEWDLVYAGADLGWTLGMFAVIVLDVVRILVSDWDYLVASAIPLCGAGLAGVWMWWRQRRRSFYIRQARSAVGLLAGFVAGLVTVYVWVGLEQVICWLVALVLAVHLGVSFVVLAHLCFNKLATTCE